MVCEELAALPSGTCEVTVGSSAKLIKGNILTPDGVLRGGQVAVDDSGRISCVGCDCAQGGETTIVCPAGTVSPGLINTHEHITFQQATPYTDTGERYEHRHEWRTGANGHTKIPSTGGASGVKISYGELRYVMGGATSIVGSGGAAGLLRNLDQSSNEEGLGQTPVEFETFPLGDSSGTMRTTDCNYGGTITPESLSGVDSFEPHTAEGINAAARNEFKCESSDTYDTTAPGLSENLLLPKTAMIHAIGLRAADYGAMAAAGTALIWSPRSNITLYGDTARVTTAARLGVEIALGTDWMPTGSMNLLRELRCASEFNATYLGGFFSDKQLWAMATINAASVTATDDVIGVLAPGHMADISIFATNGKPYYRSVIEAEPKDVVLVMRGGKVLYGDADAVNTLATGCDEVDVCGTGKRVCLQSEIGKTWSELQAAVGNLYPAFACGTPTKEPSCTPTRPEAVNGSTVYTGQTSVTDSDGDGLPDASDNCPNVFNPVRPMDNGAQEDSDGDGEGDACDVCPLDANTTSCTSVDPNDRDHDGVSNTTDNCPDTANTDQADADSDGKGDACDACPGDANPGSAGCPTTIYKIKQGMVADGTTVRITNALVTGKGSNGFFVQVKSGDAGYIDEKYSGLFVFTGTMPSAVVGTRVTVDANVATFQGQKELDTVTSVMPTTATTEAPPAPVVTTYAEIKTGGPRAAELEGVIVRVGPATVTALDTMFGEFTLTAGTDTLVVDDFLYAAPAPTISSTFEQVTGILAMRQMASKLEPRSAADLVAGAPIITGFGPALSYIREGSTGAATIPAGSQLTVTLSGPAQGNTDVTIASSNGAALSAPGGKVTVPDGMTSAVVLLDAAAQNADVTLTASLDGVMKTAHVRVLGAAEVPTMATLSPATTMVAPNGTLTLTATLDIPAPTGGTTIDLAVTPANAGTLPATLTFPADTLSQTFDFMDSGMVTSSTVTATLGTSTSNAAITVSSAPDHLVISQVYGGGGNSGAPYMSDYVEILNPSAAPISLSGTSVQYASTSGTTWLVTTLPNVTVPPGGYVLVEQAGGTTGSPLPTPDATGTVNMSATNGKVALVAGTAALSGSCPTAGVIDFVGYGTANCFEGTAAAPAPSNSKAVVRGAGGCVDSDNNATDFTAGTPAPRNSATTPASCN